MRCKMVLRSIGKEAVTKWDGSKSVPATQVALHFFPVTDGSSENKEFFAATPSGELRLGVVNEAAVASLELGKSYYVDISPAP